MSLSDAFNWFIGRETAVIVPPVPDLQERSLESMILNIQGVRDQPWRAASSSEALGVPAVFKAVSLISNTVGTLSMEAWRNGAKLSDLDTPRLVKRPDPFTPPQPFWRDSAFFKAYTGETIWWIAKRDFDDAPLALLCLDPREVTYDINRRNALRPIIKWRGDEMRNDDIVQMMYLRDPDNPLRGIGPLQACGAAISVAVEAQEWAANFYAGSPSTLLIKSAVDIDTDEAATLKAQWMAGAANLPKVVDPGIESVTQLGTDPDKAQMSASRTHSNGEVALMFSMPPSLLNASVQGSSITYQNVGDVADNFLRECLLPHYLEPMEQAMSDLLPRTTTCHFNLLELLRPDVRTRFEVYGMGIAAGIFDASYAAQQEGMAAGGIENRPIPFAAPAAIPAPIQVRSLEERREVRCPRCNKLIASEATGYVGGKCPRAGCNTVIASHAPTQVEQREERPALNISEGAFQSPVTVTVPPPAEPDLGAFRERLLADFRDIVAELRPLPPQRITQHVERDDDGNVLRIIREVA